MNLKDWIKRLLEYRRWTVLFVAVGVVLFILIVTVNFWRTLLLCAIIGVCVFFGQLMDRGGPDNVKRFFDRILPK